MPVVSSIRFTRLRTGVLLATTAAVLAASSSAWSNQATETTSSEASAETASSDRPDWPQWGGPTRDFQVPAAELAMDWPETGPRELWRRPLGDGNSAIAAVGDRLYTMARDGDRELVVALDRASGRTLWTAGWSTPLWTSFYTEYGPGPHTTPLIDAGRLYAAGIAGRLVCLDAATGAEIWRKELWEEFDVTSREFGPAQLGYSASPLLHDGRLIVVGGTPERGVLALDPETGAELWAAGGIEPAFASPIAIATSGGHQIVVFAAGEVVGLEPESGDILWRTEHETPYFVNASTPIWDGESRLIVSSAYDTGARAFELAGEAGARELWANGKLQIHHQAAVLVNGLLYGSSGDFGPAFLTGTDPATGEILFRMRDFAKANLLAAGERLIILDEDGTLALATPTPEGLTIDAKAEVFSSRSWTVPTLTGSILYARDRKEIAAFDLGQP